jgi:hypothetical protein
MRYDRQIWEKCDFVHGPLKDLANFLCEIWPPISVSWSLDSMFGWEFFTILVKVSHCLPTGFGDDPSDLREKWGWEMGNIHL